jgi:hypothetical protein
MSHLCSKLLQKSIKSMMKDGEFLSRLNNQFGWCEESEMVLHYCKGAPQLTDEEVAFWKPMFNYICDGDAALMSGPNSGATKQKKKKEKNDGRPNVTKKGKPSGRPNKTKKN